VRPDQPDPPEPPAVADRTPDGMVVTETVEEHRYPLLGVRPCDLAAIGVLDRVLTGGRHTDSVYTARRDGVLVTADRCDCAAHRSPSRYGGDFGYMPAERGPQCSHRRRYGACEGTTANRCADPICETPSKLSH